MQKWELYRRKGVVYMRPYVPGEDLTGISVSTEDMTRLAIDHNPGGMVAMNPDNPSDKWYVNQEFFEKRYEPDGRGYVGLSI